MPKFEFTYRDVVTTHEIQKYTIERDTLAEALTAVQAGDATLVTEKTEEFERSTASKPETAKCDGTALRFAELYSVHKELK